MAELPPKIPPPHSAPNWPSFPHDKMPAMANFFSTTTAMMNASIHHQNQASWVDEFLDFSSARRGAHRRSMSDSIAFLEQPLVVDECRDSNVMMTTTTTTKETNMFDRLDDDQLMSLFADDVPVTMATAVPTLSSSNPSTPSDQNSNNDEKPAPSMDLQLPKNEPGEVESSRKFSAAEAAQAPPSSNGDSIVDPKRVKRILANRQSAQRSRVRKLQYISQLERSVTTLQTEVSALSPSVAFLDHQRLILNADNSALKQRIAALAQDKIFKDAHQEALKKEIERLRQVYQQQQNLKIINTTATDNHHVPLQQQSSPPPQNDEQHDQRKGES
ncbi:Basic leucine zipper 61 [Hibiscus syriacus]|uniref:Basic leucine zipper 61 n=1 Tax=Hibiscus syriacus TaxID=106335 RepID=A0A6A3CX12_HIBSY|nr:basic leucine zipper 61-like [Hibiscus syriacus]KAE8733636.1 Basic leucine zipper 61 [Hibiscus syriacus]